MRRRGRTPPVETIAVLAVVEPVERKWRVGPPTAGVPGSMYDFVRRYVCSHGGSCTREELRVAMLAEPTLKQRIESSRGFTALLRNMRHSGDVLLEDNLVTASGRTLRRLNKG